MNSFGELGSLQDFLFMQRKTRLIVIESICIISDGKAFQRKNYGMAINGAGPEMAEKRKFGVLYAKRP